jgi:hypothetical protein
MKHVIVLQFRLMEALHFLLNADVAIVRIEGGCLFLDHYRIGSLIIV